MLPGFSASDTSTIPLRRFLTRQGYDVHGWGPGRNSGNVYQDLSRITEQVQQLWEQTGTPVALVGWSLGGLIARGVARDNPEAVRQVVTMGSPVVGGAKYTSFAPLFEKLGLDMDKLEERIAAREQTPITVPVTSIYGKQDGIVGWQACIDRLNTQVEHIEVCSTHLGLVLSPDVFRIIAGKLSEATAAELQVGVRVTGATEQKIGNFT